MQDALKNKIQEKDPSNVFASVKLFPTQCSNAWESPLAVSSEKDIENILVIGMGGSALGAYILQSQNIFTVPLSVSNEYTIPAWVNNKTLVFAISYSGSTEETLSATEHSLKTGAIVIGITTGGQLKDILEKHGCRVQIIEKNDNPCGQPRFGVGAIIMEMLKVSIAYSLCTLSKETVQAALDEVSHWHHDFESQEKINDMYEEALHLENKLPILIYSGHLANLGRFTRNQLHETAKVLAIAHEIPELNHHLMEGLSYPKNNKENVYFIFFESDLYDSKINTRIAITKEVLTQYGIKYTKIQSEGGSYLSQALIGMLRSMYLAFILGIIHDKDPNDVPYVGYFKKKLKDGE